MIFKEIQAVRGPKAFCLPPGCYTLANSVSAWRAAVAVQDALRQERRPLRDAYSLEEVITVSGPDVDLPALREALASRTDPEPFMVGPLLVANPAVEEDLAPEYRDRVRALSATAAGERRSADT